MSGIRVRLRGDQCGSVDEVMARLEAGLTIVTDQWTMMIPGLRPLALEDCKDCPARIRAWRQMGRGDDEEGSTVTAS